jgi:hypothetical protein
MPRAVVVVERDGPRARGRCDGHSVVDRAASRTDHVANRCETEVPLCITGKDDERHANKSAVALSGRFGGVSSLRAKLLVWLEHTVNGCGHAFLLLACGVKSFYAPRSQLQLDAIARAGKTKSLVHGVLVGLHPILGTPNR